MKSIRIRIMAMLGIVALGAVLSAGLGLYFLAKSSDLNARASVQSEVALITERLNTLVTAVVMDSRGVYMSPDVKSAAQFAKGIETRLPQMRALAQELNRIVPAADRPSAQGIEKAVAEFIVFRTETARLGNEVSPAAANEQGNNELNRANRKALNDILVAFGKRNEDVSNRLVNEAQSFEQQARIVLPIVLLLALAGSLGGALVFSQRSLTRPLLDLSGVMEKLTAGDTTAEVPHAKRVDEIGTMARAVAVLRESTIKVAELQAHERAETAARMARAEAMASVVSDVGEVVSAAANGDFSARLEIESQDEQMLKLVSGINEINAVVHSATSEFADALRAVAEGDLTRRIETGYRGRFAELKGAINDTVDRLSETVRTIQLTASDVGIASREISTGADDLSKRTEEQASSLEETAATTEELAASVKASAQASQQAAGIAAEAMRAAQSGGEIAGQAVDAMARIETASQKISDIIRVIDDIAFQTNLLALNAAVEAARAGDAGKGFAVVASEVRTLAQRSGEAAKDISTLISSSNTEVGEGVKLVRRAGESLTAILDASRKVADTIADISTAAGEQANGIDEMSQAVAHLDEMTQANAALSEQSAASANALSGKIGGLNDLVASFRTGTDGGRAMPALQAPQASHAPQANHAAQAAYKPAAPRPAAERPAPAPRPAAPARTAEKPAAGASEPQRLRDLAEAAFAQSKTPPAPARKVANGRADAGWEEF